MSNRGVGKMKIVLLGAANSIHCVKIANGLAQLGHEVSILSLPKHAKGADLIDKRVKQDLLPLNSYIFQGNILRKYFEEKGADLIYAHYASGYGSLLRYSGVKESVLAIWGSDIYDFPKKSPLHKHMIKRNLEFPKGLFSTSKLMAEEAGKYTNRKFQITPFGVDRKIFYPAAGYKKDFLDGIKEKNIKLVYIKSLEEVYGPNYLIEALALINKDLFFKDSSWQIYLDIYGDGSLEGHLKKLVESLDLQRQVNFNGRIANKDVPLALAKGQIFCVPSLRESFGVSEVEAMACGIVSICSDADGFREVTNDGQAAYLVPTADPGAIAESIKQIIKNPQEALMKTDIALARVDQFYSWSDNLKTIEKALQEAIS